MKKVFNASLVAASMALAFSASAATVSSTPLKMSAEGVAQGVTADNQKVSFDIVVDQLHPAASVITLTFDDNIDLDDLAAAANGAVTQDIANGQAHSGDIGFDYGTGSFTFDNVEVDADEGTISFKVNLGNPLAANSAFRVVLGNHVLGGGAGVDKVDLTGKAYVSYASETAAGVAIETGTGQLSNTVSQFAFEVPTEFDKLIERVTQRTFATDPATTDDQLQLTLSNDETLAAALTGVSAKVVLSGSFADMTVGAAATDFIPSLGTGAINGDEDEITLTLAAADVVDNGDTDWDLDFALLTAAPAVIPQTTFTAKVLLDSANGDGEFTFADNVDAGEWRLDATIVNVPYLPVGYAQFSGNVEIANEGSKDAEIIVSAIGNKKDGEGEPVTYGPVTLSKVAAAKSVTTIFEGDLLSAFGLAKGDNVKMSVTFIIDADDENISLAPYYREGSARINVISDQYKADSIRK